MSQPTLFVWRARMDDRVFFDDPEPDDVDENVVVERGRNRRRLRHSDPIALPYDATPSTTPCAIAATRFFARPETQRIGDTDQLRAHAQHVTYDPADPVAAPSNGTTCEG